MKFWALALLAVALAGCGTNPVTGQRELQIISESQEVAIGQEQFFSAQQMEGGNLSVDPGLTEYVQRVGKKLAAVADRQLPYEFTVLDNSVPNAWTLPGGKIALNRGLLQELKCEGELAAVLGHEITHAAARHGAKAAERGLLMQGAMLALQIGASDSNYANLIVGGASLAAGLITQKNGRDAERTADQYGMTYMKRAGYDPAEAVELQQTFVRLSHGKSTSWLEGLFASHQPSEERVANNTRTLAEIGAGGERGCEEYTQATTQLRKLQPAFKKYDDGIVALAKNDTATARQLGRQAVALAPNEPKFHELLGDVALRSKDYSQSLEHYRRAIELNPDYFKPHLASGVAEYNLNRRVDAEQELESSMKLLPTAIGAHYLARIAQDSGDLEKAVKYHQLAASSDSEVGRASARTLVRLDLPRNPGRYVLVEPRLDRQGRIWMLVQNRAPVAIAGVVIAAAVANPAGGIAQGPVRIGTGRATLAPGQTMQIPTSLGPFKDPQALRLVQAQVQSAQIAR